MHALYLRACRPYRRKQHADDRDIIVHNEDVRAIEEVGVAKGQDELCEIEDDGEHEVGHRDPEECPETVVVGS